MTSKTLLDAIGAGNDRLRALGYQDKMRPAYRCIRHMMQSASGAVSNDPAQYELLLDWYIAELKAGISWWKR